MADHVVLDWELIEVKSKGKHSEPETRLVFKVTSGQLTITHGGTVAQTLRETDTYTITLEERVSVS